MPKKIIIVRHGQTGHNKRRIIQGQLDILLDEVGRKQAEDVAVVLAGEEVDVIFSSDLKRALHTARATAGRMNKDITETSLLRERYFGTLQGKTYDEIREFVHGFGEQNKFALRGREKEFGAETDEDIFARLKVFHSLMAKYQDKTVLVFSHGGLIRLLLRSLGVPQEITDTINLKNAAPMTLLKKGDRYELVSEESI